MLPIIAALVLLALVAGLGFFAIRTTVKAKTDEEEAPQPQVAQAAARAPAAPAGRQAAMDRMRAGMRQRLAQRQAGEAGAGAAAGAEDDSDAGSGSESGSEDEAGAPADRRAARRAARREAREAADAGRGGKRSAYEERRAAREAEREAQEAAQEEEMRRAAEERARREEAEAAKWMKYITVEDKGEDGDESGSAAEGLLEQLAAHVRAAKTVPLDGLAAEFGLRTADVIERIRQLEEQGRLTGVMDERGKYIYVSLEEMAAVASYVRQRGRVAIAELAARSATLIDLEPKAAAADGGTAGSGGRAGGGLAFEQLLAAA